MIIITGPSLDFMFFNVNEHINNVEIYESKKKIKVIHRWRKLCCYYSMFMNNDRPALSLLQGVSV